MLSTSASRRSSGARAFASPIASISSALDRAGRIPPDVIAAAAEAGLLGFPSRGTATPGGDSYTNAYRLRELFVERGEVHKVAVTVPAGIGQSKFRDLRDYISTRLGWVRFWRK